MSYAILREALDTGGIWSVARGLARNEAKYKQLLMQCDLPRRNDLDGRGNLILLYQTPDGHTAAEIIHTRANADQPNMGMTT